MDKVLRLERRESDQNSSRASKEKKCSKESSHLYHDKAPTNCNCWPAISQHIAECINYDDGGTFTSPFCEA